MSTTPASSGRGSSTPGSTAAAPSPIFAATHWSVVLAAGRGDMPRAFVALGTLCQAYWHPLYTYVRRRGYSPEDAKDLTQEFFARLLERNGVSGVRPEKGRFRSFLLASMNHFLSDEWDKARAQKRGGGRGVVFELDSAETRLAELADPELTPERAYERRWAVALLEQVYRRLEDEHRRLGKLSAFEILRGTLAGSRASAPYAELAKRLEISEGAVKAAVHRLRRRYRALLRETIADTVSGPEEVEDELRYLFRTLSRA